MVKKLMSILLCFTLIITLVGCGAKEEEVDDNEEDKKKTSERKKDNKDDDDKKEESAFRDEYLGRYVTDLNGEKTLYLELEKDNGEYMYILTYYPEGAIHAAEELWGEWKTDKDKFTLEHENTTNLAEYKLENIKYEDEKYIYIDFKVKEIVLPEYEDHIIEDGTYKFEKCDLANESGSSEEEYTVEIGKTYTRGDSKSGGTITLNSDGTVEEKAWSPNSEMGECRGTYVIEGNKIIVTITEMYEYTEWGTIPPQVTEHIITGNNTFQYEFNGNTFVYTD